MLWDNLKTAKKEKNARLASIFNDVCNCIFNDARKKNDVLFQ